MLIKAAVVSNQTIGFVCDCCKKEVSSEENLMDFQEALHIDFTGGYGSVFGDGTKVSADICQDCLKEMISPFAYMNKQGLPRDA